MWCVEPQRKHFSNVSKILQVQSNLAAVQIYEVRATLAPVNENFWKSVWQHFFVKYASCVIS